MTPEELLKKVGEPTCRVSTTGIITNQTNAPLEPGLELYTADQLIAARKGLEDQLAKQNEPCAFLHEWIEYHPFGDTFVGEPCATITNDEKPFDSSDTVSPLFTFPPDKAQIEQETAEAIAKMLENGSFLTPESRVALAANGAAKAIRSGAWKEFKK